MLPHDSQRAGSGGWLAGPVTLSGLFQWPLLTLSDASGPPGVPQRPFSGPSGPLQWHEWLPWAGGAACGSDSNKFFSEKN